MLNNFHKKIIFFHGLRLLSIHYKNSSYTLNRKYQSIGDLAVTVYIFSSQRLGYSKRLKTLTYMHTRMQVSAYITRIGSGIISQGGDFLAAAITSGFTVAGPGTRGI